jgi:hypothetical protein
MGLSFHLPFPPDVLPIRQATENIEMNHLRFVYDALEEL